MSSYACFAQVIREEHRKKHPNEVINFTEFSKKCGDKWKEMTAEERRRFEQMADLDKERHKREMASFTAAGGDVADGKQQRGRKRKSAKAKKDPGKPKRAWSAFFFYCDEFRPKVREENPGWKVGDVAKELGRRWETCPDKSKYEEQARRDKERYERDMEAYRRGDFVPPTGGKKAKTGASAAAANGADDEEDLDEDQEDGIDDDEADE